MPGAICERKLKPRTDLGRRILLLCEAKGYTSLAEAADGSGLSYWQIYDIVTGRRDPRFSSLLNVVTALGSDLKELFGMDVGEFHGVR